MSRRTIQLTEALHEYLLAVSVREDGLLARLREETARMPQAQMQISPEQGQLLRLLVELVGARRAVEVGVFTGYSALCVARALPPGGRLVACDLSEEWTAIARRYWQEAGVDEKIDLRIGPAIDTLDALLRGGGAGAYDLAFLDADKENQDAYYERCLSLLRPGGLIAVDNVLWNGSVADPSNQTSSTVAIRALNEKMGRDSRVTHSLVPIGDGLSLARKR